MKYRWGFVEGGVFTECKPVVEDDTSLDFSQQSGEVFYRAKLNGSLLFRFAEFDSILSKGYNYEHIVVLQYYDENAADWAECWRGRFALTDCEIDYDTQTISVQPETQDRYTKILDHLEDEYNLIKIKPTQKPVKMQIRPVVQLYSIGSSKITNITTNGYYEQDVRNAEPQIWDFMMHEYSGATGADAYYFAVPFETGSQYPICMPKGACSLWVTDSNNDDLFFFAEFPLDGTHTIQTTVTNAQVYTYDAVSGVKTLVATINAECYYDPVDNHRDTYFRFYYGGNTFELYYETKEVGAEDPTEAHMPAGYTFVKARANQYVSRILLNTDADSVTWNGVTVPTVDLDQTTDIAPIANYNKIAPIDITSFVAEAEFTDIVTEYGIADNDGYFKKYNGGDYYYRPINISEWCLHSMWARPVANGLDDYNKEVEIRDCYTLPSVIYRLMKKADISLNFIDNASKSAFLFGSDNHITENAFYLLLTPRSNIISSYYDTPALNAPITFQNVLSMLKNLYKVYWFIDENNYLRFEHISYFDNGYSYTEGEPGLLVDLESHLHTNTKENKCFGQNKIKYEKAEMPEQYKFSFDDSQTIPFDGYPIKCTEAYVSKGQFDEKAISKFDTDVDMILATPSEFSKEGFVLLACPYENGTRKYVLGIKNKFKIVDEDGNAYRYSVQNYDCAIAYIQKYWWRYDLPCESIIINNEADTAKSTGKYKLQSVEFADTVLAEILADVDNCNKVIRTQQGDGKIKTLSINLNSLAAKADLLFNFVGRWYYLKGLALGNSITINLNGEPITIQVSANNFIYKYAEPITALAFNGADVVSVNFADCDKLENITSCDDMFKNCAELLSVDFGGKKLAAVTSATDMFTGCAQLTTLVCPQTSTWKPDISFADCPDLTTESVYSLIGFLYDYDSGVHTINFNSTMWNAVDADTQNDIITKAGAKGWTIGTAVAYYISGTSAANTVYATINGTAVEIPVSGGTFNYAYYAPITSLSFENDTDVATIDFSLSDGLAGVTSLADAFKGCSGLTAVDFTACDLSGVATASDAFSVCSSLLNIVLPSNSWQPDVDLSDTAIPYSNMSGIVAGLYTYTSGTHTITFNSTIWDALSVAQQQTIFDAAQLKWWTTNAVEPYYYIKGKATSANAHVSLRVGFVTPPSTIRFVVVMEADADGDANFMLQYRFDRIVSLSNSNPTNISELDFSEADNCLLLDDMANAFSNATMLEKVSFSQTLENVIDCQYAFSGCTSLHTIFLPNATFASATTTVQMFTNCTSLGELNLPNATFANVTNSNNLLAFGGSYDFSVATRINLPNATFENCTNFWHWFYRCRKVTEINIPKVTFEKAQGTNSSNETNNAFHYCDRLVTLNVPENSTAIVQGSSAAYSQIDMRYAPLNYASMLKVANWLSDQTGYTAHTCTFKASAWNALSSAEQATIDGILSGKNWTRAIA